MFCERRLLGRTQKEGFGFRGFDVLAETVDNQPHGRVTDLVGHDPVLLQLTQALVTTVTGRVVRFQNVVAEFILPEEINKLSCDFEW